MKFNYMSSSATEQVLSALLKSASIATIKEIRMEGSADFTSDRACFLLAQLIDSATMLEKCNISY